MKHFISKFALGIGIFLMLTLIHRTADAQLACPDYTKSTTDYCGTICNPTSGIFLCVSTTIPNGYNCTGSCDALNCKFVHVRNMLCCPNYYIKKIIITISKDANSSQYDICAPLTNFGAVTQMPYTNYNTFWSMYDLSNGNTLTSGGCNDWAPGLTSRDIEFDPPAQQSGNNANFNVFPLDHFTTVICGADITAITVVYVDNHSAVFTPSVSQTPCPDGSSNQNWPGCN